MATLTQLCGRLHHAVEQATRIGIDDVLRLADAHGWNRVLAESPHERRVELIKRMATALSEQQRIIESLAEAYNSVLAAVVRAADVEIERLESELQQAERHLDLVAHQTRPRTNWLALGAAGLIGYLLGNRPRPPWGCQPPRR